MTLSDHPGLVILAAGNSSRMGIPKLRMRIGDELFLGKILASAHAAGLTETVCVIRENDRTWIGEHFPGVTAIVNPSPDRGMISSVQIGLHHFSGKQGVLILPVDHPMVEPATYQLILQRFTADKTSIIIPSYNMMAGHPVLIPRAVCHQICRADTTARLSDLLKNSGENIIYLSCRDAGVLRNINSPEDLFHAGHASQS
jgi:molybdenum cofactor cytidylyltransferase